MESETSNYMRCCQRKYAALTENQKRKKNSIEALSVVASRVSWIALLFLELSCFPLKCCSVLEKSKYC